MLTDQLINNSWPDVATQPPEVHVNPLSDAPPLLDIQTEFPEP